MATEWGTQHESEAIQQYLRHQHCHGHPQLIVAPCGFYVCKPYPYLGASPDGAIYDPSSPSEPFGFLEVKCLYVHRNIMPEEACSTSTFCCSMEMSAGGSQLLLITPIMLRCRVKWLLVVDNGVHTTKGISVQRIQFDKHYWEKHFLPKLMEFYDNCL